MKHKSAAGILKGEYENLDSSGFDAVDRLFEEWINDIQQSRSLGYVNR